MIHPDTLLSVVRAGRIASLVKFTKNSALAR